MDGCDGFQGKEGLPFVLLIKLGYRADAGGKATLTTSVYYRGAEN